jgi:hypothetical protein
MAKFILTTEDGVREYPFEHKLLNTEVILLEEATGLGPSDLWNAFLGGRMIGFNAMFWLAMRRAGEKVAYSELVYDVAKLTYEEENEEPPRPTRGAKAPTQRKGTARSGKK